VERSDLEHADCPQTTQALWLFLRIFEVAKIRLVGKGDRKVNLPSKDVLNRVRLEIVNGLKLHIG
jgi:hypothetical protein